MTDRELLELAAKAAGHRVTWGETYQVGDTTVDCTDLPYVLGASSDEAPAYWNPLTDDGDALRLAVRLQMDVFVRAKFSEAVAPMGRPQSVLHGFSGREAATRSAIVRAAAEIGKAM